LSVKGFFGDVGGDSTADRFVEKVFPTDREQDDGRCRFDRWAAGQKAEQTCNDLATRNQ
jgi:hypothetical protein